MEPSAVLGHSVGEYVAAAVAGVMTAEEGMKLVAGRGRLMQGLGPGGAMAAVKASEGRVRQAIEKYGDGVSIAAVNGPESVVVSGWEKEIAGLAKELEREKVVVKRLAVSHAFHSSQMEPMLEEWMRLAGLVRYNRPNIGLISNLTGDLVEDDRVFKAEYWRRHVREPVQFAAGMKTLADKGHGLFLEIGPQPVLIGMGQQCVRGRGTTWLASLVKGRPAWQQMLETLAELYARGARVDWDEFDRGYPRRKLALPTYPFQRKRYWIESRHSESTRSYERDHTEVSHADSPIADWFYGVDWQHKSLDTARVEQGSPKNSTRHWVLFADSGGMGDALAAQLAKSGQGSTLVTPGAEFQESSAGNFVIRPERREDYARLFDAIEQLATVAKARVVYLWGLNAPDTEQFTAPTVQDHVQDELMRECMPLVHLMHGLARLHRTLSPELWLITRGAQAIGPESRRLSLMQAPLWGFGKVFALEQPEKWGGQIDFGANSTPAEMAALLQTEISHPDGEDQVAYRNGERFVARLARRECPAVAMPAFREDRSYLITGGLGGLGLKLARWMVENGARHLVLLGRKNIPARNAESSNGDPRLKALQEMETFGAKIGLASGDVSDREQMQSLLARIDVGMPPLGGIFHLATDASFATLDEMGPEHVSSMLRSKASGAWVLHELTRAKQLDCFVMYSSIVSLWGARGFAHYSAANLFLDQLAHHRRALGLPALTVDWSTWDEFRLASVEEKRFFEQIGLRPMRSEDALRALGLLMTSGAVQAGVADVDWRALKSAYELRRARPFFGRIQVRQSDRGNVARRAPEGSNDTPALEKIAEGLRPRLSSLIAENGLAAYADLTPRVDALCRDYIIEALDSLGCGLTAGKILNASGLAASLGVLPNHFRLFDRMMEILEEDGVVQRTGDFFKVCHDALAVRTQSLQQQLLRSFSDYTNEIEILGRCGGRLTEALRGEISGLNLLFPDGSLASIEHNYEKSPLNRAYNTLLKEALWSLLRGTQDRPLRILEIGAGTGGSTAYLLPALAETQVEYVYTDMAPIFLTHAKEKFKNLPWVSYQLLDLEKEPTSQGFGEHEFDMVIAANVIHATSDLRRSLGHMRRLLAPAGVLMLLEFTNRSRGADLTFGLTRGWWKFQDAELRNSYPLLRRPVWKQLLADSGFAQVALVPEETEDSLAAQQTLILGREAFDTRPAQTATRAYRSSHDEVAEESGRVNWLDNMKEMDSAHRREAFKAQIRQEVAAVLALGKDDSILEDQTFASLGLDSLTALELKNRLQKRIGRELPPTLAFDCPTVVALAEFLEGILQSSGNGSDSAKAPASRRQDLGL
ncbi:MAG: SDR family NAD(P)-dependent oxidoreductase [Candidatus Acidiferrales bacterium]